MILLRRLKLELVKLPLLVSPCSLKLAPENKKIQSLILAPTRELRKTNP
jgi:hypothetical protein